MKYIFELFKIKMVELIVMIFWEECVNIFVWVYYNMFGLFVEFVYIDLFIDFGIGVMSDV